MSEVTHFFDTICAKVQEKNQLGFGISSPHAKVLDAAVKGFEAAVVKTGVIPSEWDHKSSIGKGNLASVVWVVFLPPGQTAQDGIYISCCFGKSGNGLVAGCAISNTSKAKYHYVPTVERKTPVVDVDGTRPGTHYNNGYVNPQEFLVSGFDEDVFLKHLKDSVAKCKECLNMHATTHEMPSLSLKSHEKLQVITYGAPGTGKSWNIERVVETSPDRVIRTTFHPDCDYSTFVGAYKPTMRGEAIGYKFVAQAFTKAYVQAWQLQAAAIQTGEELAEPVYLVIEEINRGNCAQVFGDIFQLLDRENGYSKYPIKADEDLRRYLADVFAGLNFGPKFAKVQTGEDLVLPNNLCVWATMNTFDQSLFPMDSAFKRRWDWKYVPICEGLDKDTKQPLGWKIKLSDGEVDWWEFLVAINKVVKGVTNSADKQMGYFFVRAKDSVIDAEMFVNKVAFYLWNDVFKDCELDGEAFKIIRADGEVDVLAFQDFFKEDGAVNEEVLKNFLTTLVPPPEAASGESGAEPAAGGEA